MTAGVVTAEIYEIRFSMGGSQHLKNSELTPKVVKENFFTSLTKPALGEV